MRTVIGADLGGTNIRLALVDEKGRVRGAVKEVVGAKRGPAAVIDRVSRLIAAQSALIPKKDFVGVGIGVPGIISGEKGLVYSSPHYPEWKNFKIGPRLQSKIKKPVAVDNDANLIALGEHWKGAAKDWKTFLMFTLGTGIGGAIVADSKLLHGTRGFTGEFGHAVVEAEGPPCPCGSRGCLELFASASGIRRILRHIIEEEDLPGTDAIIQAARGEESRIPFELAKLARAGLKAAQEIFDQFGYYLGIGLASIINVTGIQDVVIGGGLAGAQDLFLPEAKRELANRTYAQTAKGVRIRMAQLGDDAGILGAAKAAFEKVSARAR